MGKVLAAGYHGVYLDIVDDYEYWQTGGPGAPDYPDAAAEMVGFVKSIATYARLTHDHPNFKVFVQNAEELSRHPDYVRAVSGIGKEDLFYDGNGRQPADEVRWSVKQLDRFKAAGKPVLVTDYVTRRAKLDAFYGKALSRGYVPYATRPKRSHRKPWPRARLDQHACLKQGSVLIQTMTRARAPSRGPLHEAGSPRRRRRLACGGTRHPRRRRAR